MRERESERIKRKAQRGKGIERKRDRERGREGDGERDKDGSKVTVIMKEDEWELWRSKYSAWQMKKRISGYFIFCCQLNLIESDSFWSSPVSIS